MKEKNDCIFFKVLDIFEVLEKRAKWNHLNFGRRGWVTYGVDSGIIGVSGCDICFKAKQCTSEFPLNTNKTKEYFEMIHCDFWRPYQMTNLSGFSYFLTILNDYSRAVSRPGHFIRSRIRTRPEKPEPKSEPK